jgi:3D-(3,5/4)-trihydroxycyclohexane-1,2-dione acylhydrolase (decyclizing)
VVAGGGVHYSEAAAALRGFVDACGIAVGMTQAGMGALPDAHPLSLGGIGVTGTSAANACARAADLVVGIGTRWSDFTTASKTLFEQSDVRFIAIQIHPGDASKHGALPLVGDAAAVLADLAAACAGWTTGDAYRDQVARAKQSWDATRRELVAPASPRLRQAEVLGVLNDLLGSNTTIVHAAGGLPGDLHKLWRCASDRAYHAEYGYSCMGYEIAGALGVALAAPEREVVALVGDGSYLMLHTELVTAVQEGRKLVVVLIDNGGYQCIHGLQRASGGRSFGNEFRRRDGQELRGERVAIDFAANARSLGCEAWTVAAREELEPALAAARAARRPALVHVHVEPQPLPGSAWWDVPIAAVSADRDVQAARAAYERARGAQRWWGA